MAALKDDVKAFIVHALACFDTPTQVAEAVKDEFGIEIGRQQVAAYDPTKVAGAGLGQKWRAVFESSRQQFLQQTSNIPVANQAYRLRVIDRLLGKVERQGNMGLAAQLLEQAAKETGGVFTNRHKLEHTGAGGGPIEGKVAVVDEKQVAAAVARVTGEY